MPSLDGAQLGDWPDNWCGPAPDRIKIKLYFSALDLETNIN